MKNKKKYTDYTNPQPEITLAVSDGTVDIFEPADTTDALKVDIGDNVVFENNIPIIKPEDLGYKAKVTCPKLNFRQSPTSEEDNIVMVLNEGDEVKVINEEDNLGFVFAEYEDNGIVIGGYLMKKFIERV